MTSRDFVKNEKVDVQKLIRDTRDGDDRQVLQTLKNAYGDKDQKLVEDMFDQYEQKMSRIRRKAQKFANLILTRYSHLGTKRIMEKAQKLKKKYDFTDDEFHAFVNIALSDKSVAGVNLYNVPNTPMSKTLGYNQDTTVGKMNYKSSELATLQEILQLHQTYAQLHMQVIVQSLMYPVNGSAEMLTGQFKRDKHSRYEYIHPVIFALFAPRFKYLDEHMLIGSLSNIVASRYNNIPIKTQPDYELYWDIITDPNENECVGEAESPIADLKNRINLQISLWQNVLDLRQGKYYTSDAIKFLMAIDSCKTGIFDSPDMTFVKDEGTIIRKLFGAFSLRPTIVSITSLSGGMMTANYPISGLSMSQITSIPIINFRLPVNTKNLASQTVVSLSEALEQPDWYVENKMIIPKLKNIIYSRDLLVFYVNRRFQNINFGRLVSPYNFNILPTTLSGFETLNDIPVRFNSALVVGDDTFCLKSLVTLERTPIVNRDESRDFAKEMITGCNAIFVGESQDALKKYFYLYDPQTAGIQFLDKDDHDKTIFNQNGPISLIDEMFNGSAESVEERGGRRGIIYIFGKEQLPKL